MIRLIIFAPCEKVLIGQDNHSSLISVIEHVKLSGEVAEESLPPDAGFPYNWSVFALFHRDKKVSRPTKFETKLELVSPNGSASVGGTSNFTVSNEHTNYRSIFSFSVFPIAEPGIYLLKLYLKKKTAKEFEQIGEYPIDLVHAISSKTKIES